MISLRRCTKGISMTRRLHCIGTGTCDVALATGTIKITYLYNRYLRKTIEIRNYYSTAEWTTMHNAISHILSVEITAILRSCVQSS